MRRGEANDLPGFSDDNLPRRDGIDASPNYPSTAILLPLVDRCDKNLCRIEVFLESVLLAGLSHRSSRPATYRTRWTGPMTNAAKAGAALRLDRTLRDFAFALNPGCRCQATVRPDQPGGEGGKIERGASGRVARRVADEGWGWT